MKDIGEKKGSPDLSHAKSEYNQIKASEQLKSRVLSDLKNNKASHDEKKKWRRSWMKYVATSAAVFVLTIAVMVNASPAFANTMAGIPGLSGVVKVLTFGHYEYKQNGIEANMDTPMIEGLVDKELEDKINKEFARYADTLIAEFEAEAKKIQKELPGETVHFGMDSGYQVLTNTKDCLVIDLYFVKAFGSAIVVHKYYTIDKRTQELLTLDDIFLDQVDYGKVLGEYIRNEMKRQNDSGEHVYWVDEPGYLPDQLITSDSLFYIDSNGQLVICFDEYSVAPGSEGTPAFTIPNDVIANIIK